MLFALTWIPNDSSLGWVATIGWFGWMLSMLAIVPYSIAIGVRTFRGRGRARRVG